MLRIRVFSAALLLLVTIGGTPSLVSAAQQESISFHRFAGSTLGASDAQMVGTRVTRDALLQLDSSGLQAGSYADPFGTATVPYESGTWTSPSYATAFGFTELVSSWNASTPAGTWLQVQMQATTNQARLTKWYTLGIWAAGTDTIHPTSVGGQGDADGTVAIDTFFAKDHPMVSYRLMVTLFRRAGTSVSPTLRAIGAVASDAPNVNTKPFLPSAPSGAQGVTLDVKPLSQEVHAGEYPEFDGGGEAWCSPTSTEMVVRYWGTGPTPAQVAAMPSSTALNAPAPKQDREVDYAAMHTYDAHFKGTGNWPFNTAYAASFGLDAEVTQLHSLAEAEQFISAGIPLVASLAFPANQLPGFLFKSSAGHLLVIVGFTPSGDVVVNDPAAPINDKVRKVYDRGSFERAWLSSTGGIVYVIHPSSVPLPPTNRQPNW
jgi:hypothetical protein